MKQLMKCALLLFVIESSAQNYVDIINVSWDEGFQNDYGINGESGRFSELAADLTVPIVLSEKYVILTGLTYELVNLDFSDQTADLNVHGLGLKVGMSIKHSERWSGTYLSIPKISSDEISFSNDNLQVGWIALLKRILSSDRNYKLGFYSNSEIFGPFLVPLLGYYTKSDHYEINILAPLSAQLEYIFSDRFKSGIHFKGIIKSYELNQLNGYLTKANNEVSIATTLNIGKLVWLTNVGTTIGRNLRIYPDGSQLDFALSALKFGDDRVQSNDDLENGFFIKSGLMLRFSTE
jgi:hypothetical protein